MPAPRRRPLEVEDIGDVTVVRFADRQVTDEQNRQLIGEQLLSLVDELGRRKLFLDLGRVEDVDGGFAADLMALHQRVSAVGGRLVLHNVGPRVYEVLATAKLNRVMRLERRRGDGDADAGPGGVGSPLNPPKPSGGHPGALPPPSSEAE